MKNIIISALICLSICSCTTQKKDSSSVVHTKATELASELKAELLKQEIEISSKCETISPEGYLIIELNQSDYFSDSALLTITPNHFEELDKVALKIKSMVDKSISKNSLPIMGVDIDIPGLFESNKKNA